VSNPPIAAEEDAPFAGAVLLSALEALPPEFVVSVFFDVSLSVASGLLFPLQAPNARHDIIEIVINTFFIFADLLINKTLNK
jgi:hypothetical protein